MLPQSELRSHYKKLGGYNFTEYQLTGSNFLLLSLQKHNAQPQSPSHLPRSASSHDAALMSLRSQFSANLPIDKLKQLCIEFLQALESPEPAVPPLWTIHLATNYQNLVLHWGVARNRRNEWKVPAKEDLCGGKEFGDGKAVQNSFDRDGMFEGVWSLQINISEESVIGINFVVMDRVQNIWFNNNNQNYCIPFVRKIMRSRSQIPQVNMEIIIEQIVEAETQYGSWTLMHRFNKCGEFINQIEIKSTSHLAWLFIWLRYSQNRLLDWQRNYNTKPRELQGSQNNITNLIVQKWASLSSSDSQSSFPQSHDLLRMMLECVGKGNANGQAIRDEILHIMHRHSVKETKDHFYEQWHQKLHNNTTPDDVIICEAVIEFLKTNSLQVYWNYLESHGITRQRLASFDRAITLEPHYMPQMLHDFENYLQILKAVHSANDLKLMADQAMNALGDKRGMMEEILWKRDDVDVMEQIRRVTRFRKELAHKMNASRSNIGMLRDLIFLDNSLQHYLRSQVEKILHFKLSFENYCEELSLILQNLTLSINWKELHVCNDEWQQFSHSKNILKVKAVCERIKNCLGTVVDNMTDILQPSATFLGQQFNLPTEYIEIFTEEVIRGSLFFALSMIIQKLDQFLFQLTGHNDWLIISPLEESKGFLQFVQSLRTVQAVSYSQQTVLITEKVLGDEEIPENVVAVILVNSPTYPDVLSHVSVRARNWPCFVSAQIMKLANNYSTTQAIYLKNYYHLLDKYVSIKQKGQNIEFHEIQKSEFEVSSNKEQTNAQAVQKQQVYIPQGELKEYFVKSTEFTKENVGAKSNNLERIRGKIDSWIKLPEGMTIQFNAFEEILDLAENEAVQQQLEDQLRDIISQNFTTLEQLNTRLSKCQSLVMQLNFPIEQKGKNLKSALESFGITDIKKAWNAIKRVFASKFNSRAYISTKKIGVTLEQIRMAVLIQPIIPAEYAFVIHTKNPISNNEEEIYCEVVKGLGETLVGAFKGQAMSFVVDKHTLNAEISLYQNFFIVKQKRAL